MRFYVLVEPELLIKLSKDRHMYTFNWKFRYITTELKFRYFLYTGWSCPIKYFLVIFVGKVGALLASIPLALAASILCFMWALTAALGLSTLQYSQSASFRNITIVGVSLFLGMSIPAYFQQYQPESSLILPSYLVPYTAASSGPFRSGLKQVSHFCMQTPLCLQWKWKRNKQ